MTTKLTIPTPIINEEEERKQADFQEKYEKMMRPNNLVKVVKKAGNKIVEVVPNQAKEICVDVLKDISEADLYKKAIEYASQGFMYLEQLASEMTVSEGQAVKKINSITQDNEITTLEEICFARVNDISKVVNNYRKSDTILAILEGAGTGAMGFVGIVPNLAASTFLYFRAVQSVATFYGYDIKKDPSEMEIASAVMMSAFDPSRDAINNELVAAISKFMVFTETTAVKQASKKTWEAMIEHGGLGLLIAQIRALANKAARNALQKAGKSGLEQSVFKNIFEQLGKKAGLKNVGKIMPVIGGLFGALFDTAQMNKMIEYADVFYGKRFLAEKEMRINSIINPNLRDESIIIDIDDGEIDIQDQVPTDDPEGEGLEEKI